MRGESVGGDVSTVPDQICQKNKKLNRSETFEACTYAFGRHEFAVTELEGMLHNVRSNKQ